MIQNKIVAARTQMPVGKILRWIAYGLHAVLTGVLLLPIFTPTHVEGFTASVAALSLHLRLDALSNFDPIEPLNVEFFGMTKLGWVLFVSALTSLGFTTTAAMTVLNWIAAVALVAETVFLSRKWTSAPYWSIAAALILLPGISESAFFFNDNVLASALAVGGLCALFLNNRWIGAISCGTLFGLAVLTRTDMMLLGAAIPLILWERDGVSKRSVLSLAIIGVMSASFLLGSLAAFHATIFDLFDAAGAAVRAWNRPAVAGGPLALTYFLGIPGAALVIAGCFVLVAKRDWKLCVRLLVVPLVYLVLMWGRLWEVRQILPLTPFFVALAALSLRDLLQVPRSISSTIVLGLFGGMVAMMLFGPRLLENHADGRRVLSGRVANIAVWESWQRDIRRDFELLPSLIGMPARHTRVIIVDYWNEDRFTHLALEEAGYRIGTASTPACQPIAEEAVRGDSRIVLIRLGAGYVPYWRAISGERLERWGIPCMASLPTKDIVFFANSDRLDVLFPRGWPKVPTAGSGNMRALLIDRRGIDALAGAYHDDIARVDSTIRIGTLEDASAATRRRTLFGT